MGSRISNWLHDLSTGWVALAALAVFVLFMALVLPAQAAKGHPAGSPDTTLAYAPSELYRFAETYGPEGRRAYIRARFTFDLIFPLVYAGFLITNISWLLRKAFPPASWWQRLNLVPLLGALFDYLENVSASVVMWRYPERMPVVAWLAAGFTVVKWIFVYGSFLILCIVVLAAVWAWLRPKSK